MPVIRENASLFIKVLNFPGLFTTHMEKMIPADKLLKILKPFKDRSGYFECVIAFAIPDKKVKTFITRYEIEINDKVYCEAFGNLAIISKGGSASSP